MGVKSKKQTKSKHQQNRKQTASHSKKQQHHFGSSNQSSNNDVHNLRQQLQELGLTIRTIEGDGNCQFRALCDQLYGSERNHMDLRTEIVEYIRSHKEDFEPYIVDGSMTFERFLKTMAQSGTFGGNETLVAFAQIHKCTVFVHQFGQNAYAIRPNGISSSTTEVHLSYHDGEHYNSVRKLTDERHLHQPAEISLDSKGSAGPSTSYTKPGTSITPSVSQKKKKNIGNEDCDDDLILAVKLQNMEMNDLDDEVLAGNCEESCDAEKKPKNMKKSEKKQLKRLKRQQELLEKSAARRSTNDPRDHSPGQPNDFTSVDI